MATSGSNNLTINAGQLVTEALRAIGLRVSDTADTYTTTAATIVAAALRAVGLRAPTTAAAYNATAARIVDHALRIALANTAPTSDETTDATSVLSHIAAGWAIHGLTTSGGNYEDQWEDALVAATALRCCIEWGKPYDQGLAAWAKESLEEAKQRPTTPHDTNVTAILSRIATAWGQYGTITSGGSYSDRWAQALIYHTAMAAALENNRPIPQLVSDLAKVYFEEARSFTKIDTGLQPLNLMLKAWQGKGIDTWARKSQAFTLTANQTSYAIYVGGDVNVAPPIRVLNAYITEPTSSLDTQITQISKAQYFQLSDKTATGTTTLYHYDKRLDRGTFYPWPIVDLTTGYTITLDYHRPIEDLDAVSDDLDMPQEGYEATKYNLAIRLAAQNKVKPPEEVVMLARESLADFLGSSRETGSVQFQVASE